MKSVVLVFLALATSTWALSIAESQVKVSQAKGTEVNCNNYLGEKSKTLACPRNLKPVCGTDQNTYSNECLLCDSNMRKGLSVRKLHEGNCIQCPEKEQPYCTLEYVAHCASDGRVYTNKCDFCNAYARSRGIVTFSHYGEC